MVGLQPKAGGAPSTAGARARHPSLQRLRKKQVGGMKSFWEQQAAAEAPSEVNPAVAPRWHAATRVPAPAPAPEGEAGASAAAATRLRHPSLAAVNGAVRTEIAARAHEQPPSAAATVPAPGGEAGASATAATRLRHPSLAAVHGAVSTEIAARAHEQPPSAAAAPLATAAASAATAGAATAAQVSGRSSAGKDTSPPASRHVRGNLAQNWFVQHEEQQRRPLPAKQWQPPTTRLTTVYERPPPARQRPAVVQEWPADMDEEEQQKAMFGAADFDQDGVVGEGDVQQLLKVSRSRLSTAQRGILPIVSEETEALIEEMDLDGDGVVGETDFLGWAQTTSRTDLVESVEQTAQVQAHAARGTSPWRR